MKIPISLFALSLLPWAIDAAEPAKSPANSGTVFTPNLASLRQAGCPDWFRDAKFGIWSHWGPSSVPGIGNEYPKDMYKQGTASYQWLLEHFGHPSEFGYKEVIKSWKAEKFDPDALMAKFQAAGAKYFVALATHHDNFDSFDSSHHEWNSVKVGPHKDIVGLWREATLKTGLRFGVSSHADDRAWNYFYHSRGSDAAGPKAGVPYDGANPAFVSLYNAPKSEKDKPPAAWLDGWLARHLELVGKYKPDLLYFDGDLPHGEYGRKLAAHYLNANRTWHDGKLEAVINLKSDLFLRDYERGVSPVMRDVPWQDDTSLGGWFFLNDKIADYHSLSKDAATVIHTLADVVSKNGNLLLNFPQRGDGSLYPECETVLDELAKWMPVNGEAIFGTRPWTTFGEGPNLLPPKATHLNEWKKPLTAEDVRYTTKDGAIYAIVCGQPAQPLRLLAFSRYERRVGSVQLLGSFDKPKYTQSWEGLLIEPTKAYPTSHAVVYKISFPR